MKQRLNLGRTIRSAFALMALGLVVHCAGSQTINVIDYNQSCSVDGDCVAIAAGDVCDGCCPNVSINKGDLATYRIDRESIDCDYENWGYGYDCGDCQLEAFCNKSRCDIRQAKNPQY
jgi:hypothetical protein